MQIFNQLLANLARRAVAKSGAKIVAITGSVGKTSTRQAVAAALAPHFSVREAHKNYNNEIGVPLAIFGADSPGRDWWGWIKLLMKAYAAADLPQIYVLEYGADKPGDIAYLCSIARPDVAIVTAVSPVHLSNYPNFEALLEEKASIIDAVPENGLTILNADDELVKLMRGRAKSPVITYGSQNRGEVLAGEITKHFAKNNDNSFDVDELFAETQIKITTPSEQGTLVLKNTLSDGQVSAALAAIAAATHFGIPLDSALESLSRHLHPIAGRSRLLPGIKGTLIIDDSYNAAPASTHQAIDLLASARQITPFGGRLIAALGDMAELGDRVELEHRALGRKVAQVADLFVAVGKSMNFAAEEAIKEGGMGRVQVEWFANSEEAGRFLDGVIAKGDIILVKGSQSARMEKVVKDIMAEPARAEELLVRQTKGWV